ncbi:MAG: type IV toxin-antitoxin system AbiEi family antitoxin [Actinomycetes bacterium]
MPRLRPRVAESALDELTDSQHGAVSRRQVIDRGMTDDQIARAMNREWQRSGLPGVYFTFTGPVTYLARCWAALLYAGEGAALGLDTAAWIWGVRDDPPEDVHVMVPADRRVEQQPGVRIHLRVHLCTRTHPARIPAIVRLEETVIDLVDRPGSTQDQVIDLLLRACQRRLTRADRLRAAADSRKKLRHRALVSDVLDEVVEGVQSALERRYLRDVERAHGLPPGRRNRTEGVPGRRRYRDVRYDRYGALVELDGRAAHPEEERERDDLRVNETVLEEGVRTLRYGWRSVTVLACQTAGQVIGLLRSGGWDGAPIRCGPACRVDVA